MKAEGKDVIDRSTILLRQAKALIYRQKKKYEERYKMQMQKNRSFSNKYNEC